MTTKTPGFGLTLTIPKFALKFGRGALSLARPLRLS
jgi:hypothetical protein